jgi:DSF synthase
MGAVSPQVFPDTPPYHNISTRFDAQHGALWCILDPKPRACFSFEVLEEIRRFQKGVARLAGNGHGEGREVRYIVLASRTPGVFNFGGDLALFARCLAEKDPDTLRKYALACIDVLHPQTVGYNLPLTTISLVQGDALGGGFEAALASDVLIAERSVQMGFPEVLFNLFPGMGAYNLLDRRVGMLRAERMILNGKLYGAEELHEEGVVDVLAEDGRGESALYDYIVRHSGKSNARAGVFKVRRLIRPIRYEQLLEVAETWVETAMRLGPKEIRKMERLARAQERLPGKEPARVGATAGSA